MALETGTYISDLNANNPVNLTDSVGQGDDHLRLIKSVLLNTLPGLTGAVTLTHTQINDAAQKAVTNTFLAQQRIEATNPMLVFKDTNASLDEKVTRLNNSSDQWRLQFLDDAEGTARNVISVTRAGVNPDQITFYNGASLIRMTTQSGGIVTVRSDGNTDAEVRLLRFARQDGTDRGYLGFVGDNVLRVRNNIHGGPVYIQSENLAGSGVSHLVGDPEGATSLYYAGAARIRTAASGNVDLLSAGNTDTESRRLIFRHADATARGYIGNVNSATMIIENQIHGGAVSLKAEDAGGTSRTLITADPDGSADMYHAGTKRTSTNTTGRFLVHSDGNTDTEGRNLNLCYQNGTVVGQFGNVYASDVLGIRNLIHGGNVQLSGEDAAGTERVGLIINPDANTTLRADTNMYLQVAAGTINAAIIGLGGGITTPNSSASEFGFKGAPHNVENGNYTLALDDAGRTVRKESGGAGETYTVPPESSVAWPEGTIIVIHNDGGGDLTIAQGVGVTLEEWNGSSGNKTLPDNNKAILEYVDGDLWKYSATG